MIRFLQTPGPAKKIILGGLLLVICAAMVITLVPGGIGSSFGFGAPGKGVVAKVGGEDVTAFEVQREARQMVRQQFPKGGAQASMLLPFFASRAAEQLINEKALLAEAERMGLHASNEEVAQELQQGQLGQYLFPGGNFIGREAYEDFVSRNFDMTVPQFEQAEKDAILGRKLRSLVADSAVVTDAEVHQEFERQNTKVKFDYAVLSQDDIRKALHPSDQELKAFYERNKATYNNSIPEKRKVKYVLVDTAKLQAQTQVTQAELQAYYDQHRDEYRVPEQVKVSHILIKTPLPAPDGKVDQKGVDEARKKAEDILKQLKSGANFEELAKKNSEDPGSAKEGGSLGWIGRGRTVPEFEKTAFSLPKGQISDLVQSSYGFHIIRVDDKQDAHMKSLAEVKDQIEPILKQQKATQAAESQANSLLNQARTDGINKAATAKGLQVVTTDYFARTDALPGIGNSPQFMDPLFSEREKSPPDMAQLPQGYAIFELEGVKPPATPTFEEIHSRVEDEFKNERSSILLTQKTQELSDRAKAAHDLKKAAKELGATVKTSDFVLPDGQVPDIGSLTGPANVVFSMKPGEISGPISTGGHGVVVALLDKQQPTDQDFAQKKDQIRDSLLQNKQNELFGLFVSNLRQQMEKAGKIKINQQELKTLTRSQNEEGE
jgi:peptidyl-prolyl cis-trans isomerase D